MRIPIAVACAAVASSLAGLCLAASLRVAPTIIDQIAPDAAATLTVRNDDKRPINVQVRVYRWMQAGGRDRYEATTDVVASPPATSLGPMADYVIRVVRVAARPVAGEESYRVVVDELPDPSRRKAGTVTFVLRHSVPVFYRTPDAEPSDVTWTVRPAGASLIVTARNEGKRRLKISDLRLADGAGRILARKDGLVGYVLGRSSIEWSLQATGGGVRSGQSVSVSAQGEDGIVNATAAVQASR